jgi:hypothetical protein
MIIELTCVNLFVLMQSHYIFVNCYEMLSPIQFCQPNNKCVVQDLLSVNPSPLAVAAILSQLLTLPISISMTITRDLSITWLLVVIHLYAAERVSR